MIQKPRGVRNNNPLNIEISSVQWVGKIPPQNNTDHVFEQFTTMEYGLRAAMRQIRTYLRRGWDTPVEIVQHWAPSNTNDTEAYVESVCQFTGWERGRVVEWELEQIKTLVLAMSVQELGGVYITPTQLQKAWEMI